MKRVHRMPFGAELREDTTAFRLWAPGAARVELMLDSADGGEAIDMRVQQDGWYERVVDGIAAAAPYAFRIDGATTVPDPASRANPKGVHERSVVVDPAAYRWRDDGWHGRPWCEAVVYELHVGTFTAEGTFAAAVGRLDELVDLGVTAVELMPVAAFPGTRNWGYDGVLPFAPAACYGTPDDLKQLIDEAHARGLMILLDVVYNHFGPEGNYLHVYASQFFNPRHQTPWGAAINFDADGSRVVRDFFIHNALYWLEEFHFDGLRLDAVHAIADDSPKHIVTELAARVRTAFGDRRLVHLVLENDRNQAAWLARDAEGRAKLATAQWNDDVHHAMHVLATGEHDGYYADYAERPLAHFGRALAQGFAFQGDYSAYREARRGEPSAALPPLAFVSFLQNHDQVGNRAFGERIAALADPRALRALVCAMLLSPQVPLLFMGEEFAAPSPFLFFCDFRPDLADKVREGRRNEFTRFARFRDPAVREAIPDPNAIETFLKSKLDWPESTNASRSSSRTFYRACLARRRKHIVPLLEAIEHGGTFRCEGRLLRVEWRAGDRCLHLIGNFGPEPIDDVRLPQGERVFATDDALRAGDTGAVPGYAVWVVIADTVDRGS
ncbi:MAG TPA: malto-oligosyltrehalose trehalohydrolase [Casimicrobiaceae bacterium]|nr:malto-oligosyltrehalose trehalohydrolase [Casimicrobiaceae bacterium]